ncbi:MAG: DUF2069 domain-containing protein [Luteimonas sp.]
MAVRGSRVVLAVALFALSLLYSLWFHDDRHRVATLLVFTLPPLLMLVAVLRGGARAAFWAGVLSLLWFCHGVMIAWDRPGDRGYALAEIALALTVICAASLPGLRARFGGRRSGA